MGTIQEALKELRKQRKINESNIKEASNLGRIKYDGMMITYNKDEYSDPEEVKDVIDDLKYINTDEFKDAKSVSIANFDYYIINGKKYDVRDGFLTPVGMSPEEYAKARKVNESADEENTASDDVNEFTVGAILSKFKDKDENDIVRVLPIDFDGKQFEINLSVNEDEEGNLTISGTLTPIETKEENDIEPSDDTTDDQTGDNENVELEDEEELEEDLGNVDEDGDVEDLNFNLRDYYNESINEAKDPEQKITFENIRKLPGFDNVERKAAMAMVKYAKENNDIDTIQDFKDFLDDNYGKIGVAIQMGNRLNSADFADLVADDKKFADVITKICRKINWIDDNGYYVDAESDEARANAKKPSITELIRNYIKLADKSENGQKLTYQILDKAYFDNDYSGLGKAI